MYMDPLTSQAQQLIHDLGSHCTKISEIKQDRVVSTAIQKGLDEVNGDN